MSEETKQPEKTRRTWRERGERTWQEAGERTVTEEREEGDDRAAEHQ
jgi:hypothetical protein